MSRYPMSAKQRGFRISGFLFFSEDFAIITNYVDEMCEQQLSRHLFARFLTIVAMRFSVNNLNSMHTLCGVHATILKTRIAFVVNVILISQFV